MTLPAWIRANKDLVHERLRDLDLDQVAQLVDAPADLGLYLIALLEAEQAYQDAGTAPADPNPDGNERAREARAINAAARGPY